MRTTVGVLILIMISGYIFKNMCVTFAGNVEDFSSVSKEKYQTNQDHRAFNYVVYVDKITIRQDSAITVNDLKGSLDITQGLNFLNDSKPKGETLQTYFKNPIDYILEKNPDYSFFDGYITKYFKAKVKYIKNLKEGSASGPAPVDLSEMENNKKVKKNTVTTLLYENLDYNNPVVINMGTPLIAVPYAGNQLNLCERVLSVNNKDNLSDDEFKIYLDSFNQELKEGEYQQDCCFVLNEGIFTKIDAEQKVFAVLEHWDENIDGLDNPDMPYAIRFEAYQTTNAHFTMKLMNLTQTKIII